MNQASISLVILDYYSALYSVQMHHPSLLAVCGPDPLSDRGPNMSCAMQLYCHAATKLAVVQIRSGFLPGQAQQFIMDFLTWCKQQQVTRVVSLTSSHAHERFVSLSSWTRVTSPVTGLTSS